MKKPSQSAETPKASKADLISSSICIVKSVVHIFLPFNILEISPEN